MQGEKKGFLMYPPAPAALRLQVLLLLTFVLRHTRLASVSCSPSSFVLQKPCLQLLSCNFGVCLLLCLEPTFMDINIPYKTRSYFQGNTVML